MNITIRNLMIIISMSFLSPMAQANATAGAVETAQYLCKNFGNSVCAVKKATGQCTHSWSKDDVSDPMFFCKKHIGLSKGQKNNSSNYFCKDFGGYVCAVNKKHGQCGASWDKDDVTDPMYFCLKHLGQAQTKTIDKSNYRCKKTGNGVCAQNLKTGQCTHQWTNKDHDNPMYQCQKYLNKGH